MRFVTLAGLLAVVLALGAIVATWIVRRRRQNALLYRLRAEWDQLRHRDCDVPSLLDFHHARKDDGRSIDRRTWDDLHMDSVFTVLDRTGSAIGQQALYHRLRTPFVGPTLDAFDALVNLMGQHASDRERMQLALARMRGAAAYDLWRLSRPGMLESASWHVLFPLFSVGTVLALVLTPVWPVAIFGIAAGGVGSLLARATMARRLRVVMGPFRQVGPLLAAAETFSTIERPGAKALTGTLRADLAKLSRLRRIVGWVSSGADGSVDPGTVAGKYVNALLCLDPSALFFGSRELTAHGPELFRVIAVVGEIDAAISIASYRYGSTGWTRPIWREAGTGAKLSRPRHPLLGVKPTYRAMVSVTGGLVVAP